MAFAVTWMRRRAARSSSVALRPLSTSDLKIFGVKEWSVLNLMASKRFIFFFSPWCFLQRARKAFPSEKVMITTFFFFFSSPWGRKYVNLRRRAGEREGMTLKRVERHLGDTAGYQPTDFQLWTNLSWGEETAPRLCVSKVTSLWPQVPAVQIGDI